MPIKSQNLRSGNHGVVLPFSPRRGGRFSDFTVKLCDFGLAVQVEHPDEVFGVRIRYRILQYIILQN